MNVQQKNLFWAGDIVVHFNSREYDKRRGEVDRSPPLEETDGQGALTIYSLYHGRCRTFPSQIESRRNEVLEK
jgi:hypothetical protein